MISVITTTVRPKGVEITQKCLRRQTHTDFEWIVVAPRQIHKELTVTPDTLLADPPKKKGDFWSLCKAWNLGYATAKGELVVNIQDMIWFPPDTLERFWIHYQNNPRSLVTGVGDHYSDLDERGVPTNVVWKDPRKRLDQGSFYEINFPDMEMCVASIPKQAVLDCGGIDEKYDRANGIQEKEMCMRLGRLDYRFYIDQSLEYRAIRHPRLTEDWDKHYWEVSAPIFKQDGLDFLSGKRGVNVGYVKT